MFCAIKKNGRYRFLCVEKRKKTLQKISLQEYNMIANKHSQKLINILENQKIYGGFLKKLIFLVSLSRTRLQSKTYLQGYKY